MKHILLRVTKLKTHFLHFSRRKVDINGWGGQEKLAGLVHPAACWHVFKWPSFLETKRLAVSLLGNVMWLADGYLSTAASAIHLFPQQCPCWGICCIFHSVITWFGIPWGEGESLAGKTMGCTNLAGNACTSVPLLTEPRYLHLCRPILKCFLLPSLLPNPIIHFSFLQWIL